MTAPPSHLLYLHGFRSSPRSFKAVRLHSWLRSHHPEVRWWCPQLDASPARAVAAVEQGIAAWPTGRFAVLGSSLGGFYATCIAERHGCTAVVMNPAVEPARDLAAHVGDLTAYHDPERRFRFEQAYVEELRALRPPAITRPERYLAVIAKGDEVLDWREMSVRYAGCAQLLIDGSDHALSDFDTHLPAIVRFLNLQP